MKHEKQNQIKGILCDIDGVIFDTEVFQYFASAMMLNKFLGEKFDPELMDDKGLILTKEDYKEHYVGNSTKLIAKNLILKYNIGSTPEEMVEYRTKVIHNLFDLYPVKMIQGAKEPITQMILNKEYSFALATGGTTTETKKKFEKSGILYLLEENNIPTIGFDTKNVKNSKPAPDTYLVAAKSINLAPENCLSIEDTIPGVKSALSAGVLKENNYAVPNWWTEKKDFSIATRVNSLQDITRRLYEK